MPIAVRAAETADVDALVALAAQLGYGEAGHGLAERLARFMARLQEHAVLVAPDDECRVVGWVHVARRETLETPARAEILGLVVDAACRRAGVGRALMRAAEAWAWQRGFPAVVLRSNILRPESHPFYERIGYARTKTQHVYLKHAPEPAGR